MRTFSLLVNGQDLDTGIHDYFPYTDKAIAEPRETRRVIRELRQGRTPDQWEEYIFARYCIGAEDTNRKAIEAAYKASLEFRHFPVKVRRKICHDISRIMKQHREAFVDLLVIEGHPRKLAEWEFEGMVVGGTPETIDFASKQLRGEVGRTCGEILYWARKPDGVVCCSPPGNAAASNAYIVAYTFLSGNALVIKPPLKTPLSTIYWWKTVVQEALQMNGAPPGTLNLVLGNSQTILDEWLASPLVADIVYFGDSRTGLEIGAKIYAAGKKPILELSGNDLLLVWKDAPLGEAVQSMMDCFLGSAQICMVPKIGMIHEQAFEQFVERIKAQAQGLEFGLPSDPDTVLSPVARVTEFFEFLEDAVSKGAGKVCGGERVNHLGEPDPSGFYLQPTILRIDRDSEFCKMRCYQEEIFFPLLPLVKVSGSDQQVFEKMVNFVNGSKYGLRTSVWVTSNSYERRFAKYLNNSGLLRINERHVGFSPYLSTHGGTARSGGPFGEMNYLWQKTSKLQGIARASHRAGAR